MSDQDRCGYVMTSRAGKRRCPWDAGIVAYKMAGLEDTEGDPIRMCGTHRKIYHAGNREFDVISQGRKILKMRNGIFVSS